MKTKIKRYTIILMSSIFSQTGFGMVELSTLSKAEKNKVYKELCYAIEYGRNEQAIQLIEQFNIDINQIIPEKDR